MCLRGWCEGDCESDGRVLSLLSEDIVVLTVNQMLEKSAVLSEETRRDPEPLRLPGQVTAVGESENERERRMVTSLECLEDFQDHPHAIDSSWSWVKFCLSGTAATRLACRRTCVFAWHQGPSVSHVLHEASVTPACAAGF
ncbi:hypothetical protein MHYP_G00049430 [Metynnis hypsauchen]